MAEEKVDVGQKVQNAPTTPTGKEDDLIQKAVEDLLNSWYVKVLMGLIPGGDIIRQIVADIADYVDKVEKAVAIKGAGVAKKSIVEETTVKYILNKFPQLDGLKFIVEWAVDHIIDFIVKIKNEHGWKWIPIQNGK